MSHLIACIFPIIIAINGAILITQSVIDILHEKDPEYQKEEEREKEYLEIQKQWHA